MKYIFLIVTIFFTTSCLSLADQRENVDVEKCTPFVDTTIDKDELPKNPGDIFKLAERYCKKGSKMHINAIPNWWVEYVIYNVCDMRFTVHVERLGTKKEPLASVICLYEGKIKYDQ